MSLTHDPVLPPTDSSIASRVVGWWDATDPTSYPGGVFPADNASVAEILPKAGTISLTHSGGTLTRFVANSDGRPCIRTSNGGRVQALNIFGDGTGWDPVTNGVAILALVRITNTDVAHTGAIFSGNGSSNGLNVALNRPSATGRTCLNAQPYQQGRGSWLPMILATKVGQGTNRNRSFIDGNIYFGTGTGIPTVAPTGDLRFGSPFGGTTGHEIAKAVLLKGSFTYPEFHQLGRWLMKTSGIARRRNTIFYRGNSTTEMHGFLTQQEARVFSITDPELASEHINFAVSGGGNATWASMAPDYTAMFADFQAQDRVVVDHIWIGQNDGGHSSDVETAFNTMAAQAKAGALRNRVIGRGVTPNGYLTPVLAAGDNFVANAVPATIDAAIRPFLQPWGDVSPHDSPQYLGGNVYGDLVHFTDVNGNAALADDALATMVDQVRIARAQRALATTSTGMAVLTRHSTDPSDATLTLRLVSAGAAAPPTAASPAVTLAPGTPTGSGSVAAGTYDAYASANASTPVKVGTITVASAAPASNPVAALVSSF